MKEKNEKKAHRRNFLYKFKAYFMEYKYSKHIQRFPLRFKNPQL